MSSDYANCLALSDSLRGSVTSAVVDALGFPAGSRGLDAGCGIGTHAMLLARSVGPDGHVAGLDAAPEFLDLARRAAEEQGLSERVSFAEGDVNRLPFGDGEFDWAWSSDCVGYPALGPRSGPKELARVVRSGGTVAILGWSSQQLLPGHFMLEARLNAAASGYAAPLRGAKPEQHFMRALGWFREAGLHDVMARTFVGDVRAPLGDAIKDALVSLFKMCWVDVETALTAEDLAEYRRLCLPDSPDFILDVPDYYAFFTYTLFSGTVA
jgi:demethylmenaquinone methyltransferase/2-methoxy-6-polyprenyl-1,4-benzoquinol methylase